MYIRKSQPTKDLPGKLDALKKANEDSLSGKKNKRLEGLSPRL